MALAAVALAPLTTELHEFPLPVIGPDDGLLEVEACGVCGTDWEIYRRQSRGVHLGPVVLGHETVGRVTQVGQTAARRWGVGEGDRVAVEEFLPCGECRWCREGRYPLCPATDSRSEDPFLRYGSTSISVPPGLWGGFSRYMYLHPRSLLHRIPTDLPAELATLFVPISNGLRWVDLGGGAPGKSILIQGPGQHGLGCVVAAREAGLDPIIVSGLSRSPARLETARTLGATHTIEADRGDVAAEVGKITGGDMADVVIDLVPGKAETVETAIAAAAKGARVILAASKHGKPVEGFSNDAAVRKELTIRGVRGRHSPSVDEAIGIIAEGRHPLELIATHRFELQHVDQALRVVGERTEPDAIHVSVIPATDPQPVAWSDH